jgi:UDP-N-acetylglucosamine--N-acetylmuramyl-(pentapeptide) pyrophosphoryl-undecaprenol N-acetylglucosamine transferase
LLVPYPYAAGDHQRENAASLVKAGAALSLGADVSSSERLAQLLNELLADAPRLTGMAEAARRLGRPEAAELVARDLLLLAGLRRAEVDAGAPSAEREQPPAVGPVQFGCLASGEIG